MLSYMKSRAWIAIPLCLLAGCAGKQTVVLGVAPVAAPIIAIRDLKPSSPVVAKGVMVEKCPVAGCWFMLRDKTGLIKVDTKAAGFVVSDVPLNTEVTVGGKVKETGERMIAATGIRY
jgi:uncharacterized protein YdeI (BOF family)